MEARDSVHSLSEWSCYIHGTLQQPLLVEVKHAATNNTSYIGLEKLYLDGLDLASKTRFVAGTWS
jgi:hypothetical protein